MDHAFIGCTKGAPEGDALRRLGFIEGSGNTHPGQGTANRRFFFENFMLELLWISNPVEVLSERTRHTRLWDRCERQDRDVSPFGIIFGASSAQPSPAPYPTWDYAPEYLPPGLAMQIAEGTTLYEPELFYLPLLHRVENRSSEPRLHAVPIGRIRALSVGVRRRTEMSMASRSAESHGLLSYFDSPRPLLELVFEGPAGLPIDFRPDLPLVFRSASPDSLQPHVRR